MDNVPCPACGSGNVKYSRSKTISEKLKSALGYCPVRCRECGHRFFEAILWLPGMGFARCPKCLREDLADWDEPYRYPPQWQQLLLKLGAKAHRCPPCRLNFVSFRRRRRAYVPSWKQQGGDSTPPSRPEATERAVPASHKNVPNETPVA